MIVVIIGRGHSGTRAIAQTLKEAGIYIGDHNKTYDTLPTQPIYQAAKLAGPYVGRAGLDWDFSRLVCEPMPGTARDLVQGFTKGLARHESWGWKIPQTVFLYPWIVRMFPDAHYIHWTRDPRDALLKQTFRMGNLDKWGIDIPSMGECPYRPCVWYGCLSVDVTRLVGCRALAWKYAIDIVHESVRPSRFLEIRFEDFILDQSRTLERVEDFLGLRMPMINVSRETVGRYLKKPPASLPTFLHPAMERLGYV